MAGGKALSDTRVGDGQAGSLPDQELGHLEVRVGSGPKMGQGKELWVSSFIYWLIHSVTVY